MAKYYSKVRSEILEFIPLGALNILEVVCAGGNFGAAIKKDKNLKFGGLN